MFVNNVYPGKFLENAFFESCKTLEFGVCKSWKVLENSVLMSVRTLCTYSPRDARPCGRTHAPTHPRTGNPKTVLHSHISVVVGGLRTRSVAILVGSFSAFSIQLIAADAGLKWCFAATACYHAVQQQCRSGRLQDPLIIAQKS